MTRLRIFLCRLWATCRAQQLERQIEDEITSHLAEAAEEYVQQGLSPEEARWAAQRSFGGVLQSKEVYRQVRSFVWLEESFRDVRYALRMLRKSPGFTVTAVATLALAIGTNTAMFSVLNAVLLRPLPYASPEQLAMLWTEDPTQNVREARSTLWDVEQWRAHNQSLAEMATFDAVSATLTGADGAEQIVGASISPNLLSLLGVQPVQGRSFSAEEAAQEQRLVLISYRFWLARFGESKDAIGATIVLYGLPSQVIGVLPAAFQVARIDADVWWPHTRSEVHGSVVACGNAEVRSAEQLCSDASICSSLTTRALGKTIEAGLIAPSLPLRNKAMTIVVAAPPSVLEQWKVEPEEQFGLVCEILDRAYLACAPSADSPSTGGGRIAASSRPTTC